jgi:hypothetical protein
MVVEIFELSVELKVVVIGRLESGGGVAPGRRVSQTDDGP